VAVHRSGARVEKKVGEIRLRPGDTLLLQTGPHFLRAHRNDPSFYLVSDVQEWRPIRYDRAWLALALFAILLVLMTTGMTDTLTAAAFVAVLMVAVGCLSAGEARSSIEWQVLITIAAAFGVGSALENSGAAAAIAETLFNATHAWGPIAALICITLVASLMTEMITNNAAAVLMFPFCLQTAALYDASPRPFLIALVLAASASFMTPIGYQTNLMVYGPGGYRFADFLIIGGPLKLVLTIVAVLLIPLFWPF
jgi:di/tricarboxylate transporter